MRRALGPLRLATLCAASRLRASCATMALGDDGVRLQRSLDSVDLGAPPRVELTAALGGGVATPPPSSLAVLDSSFNPPTRAHMHMLSRTQQRFGLERSLLLLAKQNADKPVVGASLVQRLQMMETLALAAEPAGSMLTGVTAHPLFVDKAAALQGLCAADARIFLLVGYDTWVRIVDPKYYGGEAGLQEALKQIFAAVDVVVASRELGGVAGAEPLSAEEQQAAVDALPSELTGGRLHFLANEMAAPSSSALRAAIAAGESGAARAMLPEALHAFVDREGVYQ